MNVEGYIIHSYMITFLTFVYNFEFLFLSVKAFNMYYYWDLVRGIKNHDCDITVFFTLKVVLITEGLWSFLPLRVTLLSSFLTTTLQQIDNQWQPARNVTSRKQSAHSSHVSSNNILRKASSTSISFFHLSVQETVPWLICSEFQWIPSK